MSELAHDEFLALCALSTSGELSAEEQARLRDHLAVCPSCREAQKQYDSVARDTIPAFARDPGNIESDPSWSQDEAEAVLFQRLTLEDELGTDRGGAGGDSASPTVGRIPLSASQATWRNVWVLCAAGVLLCIALGVSAYQVGIRRGAKTATIVTPPPLHPENQSNLEQQLSDAGHEREVLRASVEQRDKEISSLRQALEQQSSEMKLLKHTQSQLETDLQSGQADRQALLQHQSDLTNKLEVAQAQSQGLQARLASLEHQSAEDKQRASSLEVKLADLNQLLRDREITIDQQQELLTHDRDIRDLMGARDLYVAEVYDVERTGETNKPYGRVFYTKGRSLIFYAYDLDQQRGVKAASTFQAWGRRGPDFKEALNLGIFYADNSSKKRWVLKFDDPKALAQIDAVFVTVEPNGGSHRPSNRPPLFAYLHIDPNHP